MNTPMLDGIQKEALLSSLVASKLTPLIPAAIGAGSGALIDDENRGRGAIIGALAGGGLGLGFRGYLNWNPELKKKIFNSLYKVDQNIDWVRRGHPWITSEKLILTENPPIRTFKRWKDLRNL